MDEFKQFCIQEGMLTKLSCQGPSGFSWIKWLWLLSQRGAASCMATLLVLKIFLQPPGRCQSCTLGWISWPAMSLCSLEPMKMQLQVFTRYFLVYLTPDTSVTGHARQCLCSPRPLVGELSWISVLLQLLVYLHSLSMLVVYLVLTAVSSSLSHPFCAPKFLRW